VFSGTLTTTPPYKQGENDEYQGNTGTSRARSGRGRRCRQHDLSSLLGNGAGSGDGKLLDTLRTISEHLLEGTAEDKAALNSTDLKALDANDRNLTSCRRRPAARPTSCTSPPAGSKRCRVSITKRCPTRRTRCSQGDDRLLQRAGRLPGGATGGREHRPGIAAQLPQVERKERRHVSHLREHPLRHRRGRREDVIEFPFGLIGLGGLRYTLLDRNPGTGFLWLHSVDDSALALPVVDPHQFFADFSLDIHPEDRERTGSETGTDAKIYVTVRATPNPLDITANLRAPLVIHEGAASRSSTRERGRAAAGAAVRAGRAGRDRPAAADRRGLSHRSTSKHSKIAS
jgi:flagellar assembly factor FliW